ncbi:MAG TPA: hypothetical protein VFU50_13645 [Terriglobales bacterium]|nr:hypothetical protein [Terriglobales bacterium]
MTKVRTGDEKAGDFDPSGKKILPKDKKLAMLAPIFTAIADDTTFYLAYGRFHSSRFLTDRAGETMILDWLTQDDQVRAKTDAMQGLLHSVPLLMDLPIATIVRIRREERDAFEAYREALSKTATEILNNSKGATKKQVAEMFRSCIQPQLTKMRTEVMLERKRQIKRVLAGAGTLAAGVALGAFGGLPIPIATAAAGAAAVIGGRLLGKAAEVACEHGANLRQDNELYFLLRLVEEGSN